MRYIRIFPPGIRDFRPSGGSKISPGVSVCNNQSNVANKSQLPPNRNVSFASAITTLVICHQEQTCATHELTHIRCNKGKKNNTFHCRKTIAICKLPLHESFLMRKKKGRYDDGWMN